MDDRLAIINSEARTRESIDLPLSLPPELGGRALSLPSSEGQRGLYPWPKWLDGKLHVLTPGKDFNTPFETFRTTFCNSARRRGLFPVTAKQKDGKLAVQAFKTDNERKLTQMGYDYDDGYGDIIEPDADGVF